VPCSAIVSLGILPFLEGIGQTVCRAKTGKAQLRHGTSGMNRGVIAELLSESALEPAPTEVKVHLDPG
jgi:hypothetical protein